MWEMIKAEFRHIWRNKLLRLSVFVVCFIPFLYSIFFLKSVWDPYGNTQNLPVAVVNKDVPVEYQGKTMAVGRDTVKELKKNKELKWEFVSAKKAHYGLRHRQYYTVVTIPKNFSQDATTVLNKHPKKMEVKYETNGSLNYIAEVISELGMNRLNQEIRYQVTKAYAKATFKALKAVGKGMTTAADGAGQLAGGTSTLNSGFAAYAAGVSQVNTGVQTLNSSVGALGSGASQLANGSGQLASGIAQYTGGVGQLQSGLGQLTANSGALRTGAGQLQSAAGSLTAMKGMLGQLNTGQLMDSVGKASALGNQINGLQQQLGTIQSQLQKVDVEKLNGSISNLNTAASQAQSGIAGGLNDVKSGATSAGAAAQAIAGIVQSSSDMSAEEKAKIMAQVQAVGAGAKQAGAGAQTAASAANGLQTNLTSAKQQLGTVQGLLGQMATMNQTLSSANQMMNDSKDLLNQLNGLSATMKQLQASGMLDKLNGINPNDINKLVTGIDQYTAGVDQAAAGANQLAANSGQLTSGANTLASSLQMLNRQVPTLVAGVAKLAAGTAQLNANTPQLVKGITQLNAGAGELADKLAAGAKQVNSIRTSNKTADMIAKPTTLKHKSYSYVPNYGHALAPYVLSVAIYVGALVFNFVYPIRRVALQGRKASSWWASKVAIEALVALAMAVAEGGIMMALGLEVKHVPSFFLTLTLFAWASFALVMFLSMTFDNPGRFVAMVLLMLQLGGSGGTFPMEVTMKFYNAIHWYLPMTYSILGLRNGISGGLGEHYVAFCNSVLTGIIVVFVILSLLAMIWLQKHHFAGKSELDNNQELLGPEHDDDGMHLQDRDQTI